VSYFKRVYYDSKYVEMIIDLGENIMKQQRIRILLAKPGLDGHDRGAKFLARAFRDNGMEVIYTGLHQKIPKIVISALQEDVDVVGLSILSGSHLGLAKKYIKERSKYDFHDHLFLVGGTIPEDDVQKLKKIGVDGVFGVESDLDEMVRFIREHVKLRR